MTDDDKKKIEHELKMSAGFSLENALIDQGGDYFKDVSLVPRLKQVQAELILFVRSHCQDSSGALVGSLEQRIRENDAILAQNLDCPFKSLSVILEHILTSEDSLIHFVREVDQRYGQLYNEKPFFQKKGQEPHPEDEYTHEGVYQILLSLSQAIQRN